METLSPPLEATRDWLLNRLGDRVRLEPVFRGQLSAIVPVDELVETVRGLRDDSALAYRFLSDITAVDWLPRVPRFQVVYHLFSLQSTARVRLKVEVDEGEAVPSLTGLWTGANFPEREIFDMFGIPVSGHPNLERILNPEDMVGHPLRQDFELGSEVVNFDIPHRRRFTDASI